MSKNDYNKIEVKSKIYIKVFCYENKLTYPGHISHQKFENSMESLEIKLNHIMCTSKILTNLCLTKQKTKTKNTFENIVYSVLAVKNFGRT